MNATETLAYLQTLTEPSREASDRVLETLGHTITSVWVDIDGQEWPLWKRPHVTADLQAALDHVVPEGFRVTYLGEDYGGGRWLAVVERPDGEGGYRNTGHGEGPPALALCIASMAATVEKE